MFTARWMSLDHFLSRADATSKVFYQKTTSCPVAIPESSLGTTELGYARHPESIPARSHSGNGILTSPSSGGTLPSVTLFYSTCIQNSRKGRGTKRSMSCYCPHHGPQRSHQSVPLAQDILGIRQHRAECLGCHRVAEGGDGACLCNGAFRGGRELMKVADHQEIELVWMRKGYMELSGGRGVCIVRDSESRGDKNLVSIVLKACALPTQCISLSLWHHEPHQSQGSPA